MEAITWVPVKNFESKYWVSSSGEIKSLERHYWTTDPRGNPFIRTVSESILQTTLNVDGYMRCLLKRGNQAKSLLVHRVIAEAFIPNPENKPFINHINGVKTDNRIKNLEWCTPLENRRHAIDILGLKPGPKRKVHV